MLKRLFQLVGGAVSGYAFIQWLPITKPISATKIILALVMDPWHYFIAMVAFFFSFLLHSILIKSIVEETYSLLKRKTARLWEAFISCGSLGSFFFLAQEGEWQALLILCFSVVYGMISVDLRRKHAMDTHY
ncbi:hypothetical protein [Priestia abyssalis]|uniref:hypothetical protein n=1 Tax=Priestia abyssalis TaxID=1221450 RepID=UPI000995DB89|nr:hypothetical protein [Priestia abyssalis]